METAPVSYALEHEEVGDTGGELDVRRPYHRAAVEVRRDHSVVDLADSCDFLGLQDAARTSEVWLQNRRRACFENPGEFVLRGETFTRGNRDRRGGSNLGHLGGIVWWRRLFEPEGLVRFEAPGEANSTRRGELPMCPEQDVRRASDGGTNRRDETLAELQSLQRRLPAVVHGIGTGRIDLYRRESPCDLFGRTPRSHFRVDVDVTLIAIFWV